MEQYVIYLRKSRADEEAEQRGEGETLARHEKALLELSKRLGLTITDIYREVVSGETIAARPQMQKLLAEVGQGVWSGVLVMEIERLARGDTMDQGLVAQTFKFSGTKIITPTKIYDPNNEFDEEYFEFGLFMSRREYKTINRRLQAGRAASVKEGKFAGNRAPYGYQRVKIPHDKGYTLSPQPEEAKIVQLIYQWYTNGVQDDSGILYRLGCNRIARRLNEMGIPPRSGTVWTASTIRDILCNPTYIGKVRWGRRAVKKSMDNGIIVRHRPRNEDYILENGLHEPILSAEIFEQAQKFIEQRRSINPNPGDKKTKNPLSGLIICGKCGRKMVRRPSPGNSPDYLICREPTCTNVGSTIERVERKLLAGLQSWASEYRIHIENNTKEPISDNSKSPLPVLRSEEEKLLKQSDRIHTLLEQEVYSVQEFLERSKAITVKLKKVQETIKSIERQSRVINEQQAMQKEIIPKIDALLNVYNTLSSPEAKNKMLKQVLEKAIYTKEHSTRWHGDPDDFKLVLYPKLRK